MVKVVLFVVMFVVELVVWVLFMSRFVKVSVRYCVFMFIVWYCCVSRMFLFLIVLECLFMFIGIMNKVIVIIGVSSGFGEVVVRLLVEKGVKFVFGVCCIDWL